MGILNKKQIYIQDISLVGGVAANKKIYQVIKNISNDHKCRLIVPPLNICGDNAAMIALACLQHYRMNVEPDYAFNPNPRWNLGEIISL